ncbi:hypothetical protein CDEST_01975 [Colletotrichum destructivum]|uniref:Uncharacterized protein n=1 Tax=Colletotrichum destructivum TaxID=34406 RepID=A0AAX4I1J0_9PEZI|nr:hypothetical protein CDEST_01975 [Colletotrichum destructivum]
MRKLQLRSISRFNHARDNHSLQRSSADGSGQGALQLCTPNTISWWPPKLETSQDTSCPQKLDNILNPKDHDIYSPISGVMDDRSMIYAVEPRASQSTRPLIFISFDPAIRLLSLVDWPGGPTMSLRTQPKTQGDNATSARPYPTPQLLPALAPASRHISFSEGSCPGPRHPSPGQSDVRCPEAPTWIRRAPAAYLQSTSTSENPSGFNFAHVRYREAC